MTIQIERIKLFQFNEFSKYFRFFFSVTLASSLCCEFAPYTIVVLWSGFCFWGRSFVYGYSTFSIYTWFFFSLLYYSIDTIIMKQINCFFKHAQAAHSRKIDIYYCNTVIFAWLMNNEKLNLFFCHNYNTWM